METSLLASVGADQHLHEDPGLVYVGCRNILRISEKAEILIVDLNPPCAHSVQALFHFGRLLPPCLLVEKVGQRVESTLLRESARDAFS